MSVMELVKKLREKRSEDRNILKEMQRERRLQKIVFDREKSSNERELEKRLKLKREENIKSQLEKMRNEDKINMRKNMFLNQNNIFKGHKSILTDNKKLFSMRKNSSKNMNFFEKGNVIKC